MKKYCIEIPSNPLLIPGALYEVEYASRSDQHYRNGLLEYISMHTKSSSAIDVGCGIGLGISSLSAFYSDIYACDISREYIDYGLYSGRLESSKSFLMDFSSINLMDDLTNPLMVNLERSYDVYSLFCTLNYLHEKDQVVQFFRNAKSLSCGGYSVFQFWNSDVIKPKPSQFISYPLAASCSFMGSECNINVNRFTVWEHDFAYEFKTCLISCLSDENIHPFTGYNEYHLWKNDWVDTMLHLVFNSVNYITSKTDPMSPYKIALCK